MAGLALLAAALLAGQAIGEDFSAGMPAGWWTEGGERVFVEDGRLHMVADNPGVPGGGVATVWCRTPHPGNFRLDVDAHVISSSLDANNINLFFSYSDPGGKPLAETRDSRKSAAYNLYHSLNGYIITFVKERGKARIRIRRNPGFQLLAELYSGSCERGITYRLTVIKSGGDIRFEVDGRPVLTARDPSPLAGGLLGLRTFRTVLWWDNVTVRPLD